MKIGLIDVIEWQTPVNFKTGRPVEVDHPLLDMTGEILRAHPYPGDLSPNPDAWVTDVALKVDARYQPDFMLLTYASVYFASVFTPLDAATRASKIQTVFDEIQRFLAHTGFTPIIVGLGDLVPLQGMINVTGLEGLAVSGGMTARYAGLNDATPRDLEQMAAHPGVARVIDRAAFREQFGGAERFYKRFPDYLLMAREGHIFRGVGSGARPLHRLPGYDSHLPLRTPLGETDAITGVADLALQAPAGEKVALIVVEGVGCETFPLPFQPISNACHWFRYAVGEGQYLTLTTGQHFVEHPYPPGYRYYLDDDEHKPYPFSGIFSEMSPHTIGARHPGKTAAVGSRAILTHAVAGTDVTIECFARTLYNHGVMAALTL